MSRKIIIIGISTFLGLFLLINLCLSLPTISFRYSSGLALISFFLIVVTILIYFIFDKESVDKLQKLLEDISMQLKGFKSKAKVKGKVNPYKIVLLVLINVMVLALILPLFSLPLFRSSSYYDVIADDVIIEDFSNDFDALTIETISSLPNIDSSLAQKKATTTFGETKGFGSEYQLGMFTDQIVNGQFVTIAPIEYNGFFKYNKNKDNGTPGYVMVDKQNYSTTESGAKMMLKNPLTEKNYSLKYLPSSYFSEDLNRHIYYNGYMNSKYVISGFELDDNYNPYWVVNIYENTIAPYGLKLITKVLLVDAQTGAINEYKLDEVPQWVDNVQDSSVVMDMVNNFGKYEDGFWNSVFAQSGVTQTTHGSRHVIVNGELHLFTGLTSVGADESISQIVLVNKRTLKTTIYNVSGATEYVAMGSAEGKLQNYGYEATFPIPVNINNVPSYFIPLKDSSGLIKHYTFVQISNHTVIGSGETINQAYTNYLSLLSSVGDDNLEEITGVIQRISFVEGIAYVLIDNKLYYMPNLNGNLIVVSKEGDNVTLKVLDNMIVEFQNNTLQI